MDFRHNNMVIIIICGKEFDCFMLGIFQTRDIPNACMFYREYFQLRYFDWSYFEYEHTPLVTRDLPNVYV